MGRKRAEDSTFVDEANVLCPFFRVSHRREVGCEGFSPETYMRVGFRSEQLWAQHQWLYCCKDYTACPLYPLINNQYREDSK